MTRLLKRWSKEEIDFVRDSYNKNLSCSEIAEKLNRSKSSVENRIFLLNLVKHKKYSDKEIQFIKENYPKLNANQIAKQLNRTSSSIVYKIFSLGIKYKKRWTNEEIDYLKANYPIMMNTSQIAKNLNRSNASIIHKCFKLGLKQKVKDYNKEIEFIKNNSDKLTDREMSKKLNLKETTLIGIRSRLGIKKNKSLIYKRLYSEGKLASQIGDGRIFSEWNKKYNASRKGKTYEEVYDKETGDRIKRLASERMTKNNPSHGGLTEEHCNNIAKATKVRWDTHPEIRENILKALKEYNDNRTPEQNEKSSKALKKRWKDPEFRKKMENLLSKRPTKPEKIVINIINQYNLNLVYVGDGKKWLSGKEGSYNPDFVNYDKKAIVEVFGDYWHRLPKSVKRDEDRIITYSKQGYMTLILWEKEINNNPNEVAIRLKNFLGENNG